MRIHIDREVSTESFIVSQSATISAKLLEFNDLFLEIPPDLGSEKWNSYSTERKILILYIRKVHELSDILFEKLKARAFEEKFDSFSTFTSDISCHFKQNTIDQLLQTLIFRPDTYESKLSLKLIFNANERTLKWKIKDNGGGVPAEVALRLFHEKYFTTKRLVRIAQFGGTGLGLTWVKEGCIKVGGECGFRNNKIGGASFWFKIPLDGCQKHLRTREYQNHLESLNSPAPNCTLS